ncbi:Trm112p-like protein [Mannheimia haemolytica]|uniref:Trm112p-like protein n=1 Tax=Mannheimia haemolytica TaxID=75985 RepID=A0A1D2Q6Q4_MANHA|nr:Trm112 family protein [Mannheimia haemolytica]ODQ38513.1 tetraacyldisaccharide 4'-kinase [Mannheimia haemolytica]UQX67145.1 Trm112 family protein [Mannheimia haemolytica]STY62607.1 Trm112p-like protein [Mannheimia haemolytica]VEI78059.1 Trm112p-like protein [Mannheimia haemolytica]
MNETLLNNLVCPVSNEKLEWDKENNRLINPKLKIAYPIKNGIPELLPEAGVAL